MRILTFKEFVDIDIENLYDLYKLPNATYSQWSEFNTKYLKFKDPYPNVNKIYYETYVKWAKMQIEIYDSPLYKVIKED